MREKAKVLKIEKNKVLILPLITDACISCTSSSSCAKNGEPFWVENNKNLPIEIGSLVSVAENPSSKAGQGIVSILFPVCVAIIFCILAGNLALKTAPHLKELFQVLGVLLGIILSATSVLLIGKFRKPLKQAEIDEIL